MAATGSTLKSGMLGLSRLASANPTRAAAGGLGNPQDTASHVGELLFMVVVELVILAIVRKQFKSHHGG